MIPKDEQPYPLPNGWQWLRLLDSFINQTSSKKKIQQKNYLPSGQISVVDQGKTLIGGYTNDTYLKFSGELPIILFGDHTRCVKYIDFPFVQGADGVKLLKPKNFYLPKAFYYAFQTIEIPDLGYRRHFPLFKNYFIPLPPLNEQQRIVELLDELFAKLDEVKSLAQGVVNGSEFRRAAILHKAFTGELTENWRDEHGTTLDSWENSLLGDVCKINPPKISTQDLPNDLEVSFVPMAAVSAELGEITDPQKKTLGEVKSGFTNFSEGDVLFAKITPCMENGKSAIVGELINQIGYGSTEFFVLRCGDRLLNKFVYHLVRGKLFRGAARAVMGGSVGQQRVPKNFLIGYQLNLPPLDEQKEIVRLLDDLLGREQKTKDLAGKTLARVEMMKKSILTRAFRGELKIT